jgi:hypothetical protein
MRWDLIMIAIGFGTLGITTLLIARMLTEITALIIKTHP